MINEPTQQQLTQISKLYETEGIPLKEKTIYIHFQFDNSHWYIAEFDGYDTFFGFAILNGDLEMAEWGHIPFSDLKSINIWGLQIQNDPEWKIKKASEVELICKARGWVKPK